MTSTTAIDRTTAPAITTGMGGGAAMAASGTSDQTLAQLEQAMREPPPEWQPRGEWRLDVLPKWVRHKIRRVRSRAVRAQLAELVLGLVPQDPSAPAWVFTQAIAAAFQRHDFCRHVIPGSLSA